MAKDKQRCSWCSDEAIYIDYHDHEWGEPVYDDQQLFAMLNLEGMQAGLSWITILKKRQAIEKAFAQFNPHKLLRFSDNKKAALLENPRIIRNKLKINSVFTNAQAYLDLLDQGINFSDYLWQFTDGKIIKGKWRKQSQVPTQSPLSDSMAKSLKQQGFKFVGSTICYAFMQAVGMLNNHTMDCYKY